MIIQLKQTDSEHLEAQNEAGGTISVDISDGPGGVSLSPMQLAATSLGGCSSYDVLEILRKQRQKVEDFRVRVKAERAGAVPAVFTSIHLTFSFEGDVEVKKAERAVELSLEKYCSVARMLEKTAEITFSVVVNGE